MDILKPICALIVLLPSVCVGQDLVRGLLNFTVTDDTSVHPRSGVNHFHGTASGQQQAAIFAGDDGTYHGQLTYYFNNGGPPAAVAGFCSFVIRRGAGEYWELQIFGPLATTIYGHAPVYGSSSEDVIFGLVAASGWFNGSTLSSSSDVHPYVWSSDIGSRGWISASGLPGLSPLSSAASTQPYLYPTTSASTQPSTATTQPWTATASYASRQVAQRSFEEGEDLFATDDGSPIPSAVEDMPTNDEEAYTKLASIATAFGGTAWMSRQWFFGANTEAMLTSLIVVRSYYAYFLSPYIGTLEAVLNLSLLWTIVWRCLYLVQWGLGWNDPPPPPLPAANAVNGNVASCLD